MKRKFLSNLGRKARTRTKRKMQERIGSPKRSRMSQRKLKVKKKFRRIQKRQAARLMPR